MTYEEKLDHILRAIVEAKKAAIKGQSIKIYISDDNELSQIGKEEVWDILHKLEIEEKILSINNIYNRLLPLAEQPKNLGYILIDLRYKFENWYENYLIKTKTSVQNLDYINMLRIYDTVLDINEQIQLTHKTTISIHLLPELIRFSALFPIDTIGMRDKYCETRWDSLKYLKEEGIIDEFKHNSAFHRWDTVVTISLKLSTFDNFLKKIQSEYVNRNKADDEKDKTKAESLKIDPKRVDGKVVYNAQKGELDIEGKKVKLNKDSFRAKLLELLLRDDESRKKEWSWDEVVEIIEDTKDVGLTKESKNKFYPACDGLSKHIASKTGVNDLLTYTKSTVQINSKYI